MKTKMPTDPAAVLKQEIDGGKSLIARLEAENGAAVQEEEQALERDDTGAIVATRSRATAVADALTRQRERLVDLEAQLLPLERSKAEDAACAPAR